MTAHTNQHTRRQFLQTAGAGLGALALPACTSQPAPAAAARPFTFAQVCDPQLGFGGYAHDVAAFTQAVRQLNALRPDFVVICGDLVHAANAQSYADFNRIKAELTMPCHGVPGNHDLGARPTPATLQNFRQVAGRDHCAFEHAGHAFVLVNTQLWKAPLAGETGPQDAWLRRTLAATARQGQRTFVVGHYPLYLKAPDEAEQYWTLPSAPRHELLGLFAEHNVVAVLGGHTHRLIVNDYRGIQLVNAETTSKNFDQRPLGFRLWHVEPARPCRHEFVALEGFDRGGAAGRG